METRVRQPYYLFQTTGESNDDLPPSDFFLCIQTAFQKEMMARFSNKMICMDSTQSTIQCIFLLTTILVIDNHREELLVAWAILNREDT